MAGRSASEQGLPFEMRVPNRLTAETLARSERGEDLHRLKTPKPCLKTWVFDACQKEYCGSPWLDIRELR